jgi:DNA-binding transcriptional MerR regulator
MEVSQVTQNSQLSLFESAQVIQIPDRLFFRIGDVAELLGVKPYVLRFWETEFPFLSPEKSATGQRVYKRSDVETLAIIKHLLYSERYSIEGAIKKIRELRKEGEYKTARKEVVQTAVVSGIEPDHLKKIKDLAQQLQLMSQWPMDRFFKY